MQTFLPYRSFTKTASVLDYRRLGKQRVEAWQILNVLLKKGVQDKVAWSNHPAVLMWENHEMALCIYGAEICKEWIRRGYKDTMLPRFSRLFEQLYYKDYNKKLPSWLGNIKFHKSHKSNLLRKDKEHYKKFKWNVSDNLEYVWPTKFKDKSHGKNNDGNQNTKNISERRRYESLVGQKF